MVSERVELDASGLRAIEEHKWYLSERSGREVSIEEAIEDFRARYWTLWIGSKQQRENREQLAEMERHRWYRSQEEGRDIGKEQAATEWVLHFAELWRRERDSLEANGFLEMIHVVEKLEGQSIELATELRELATHHDCDVYLHFPRMDTCNFVLGGKEYLSVRSRFFPGKMAFQKGDRIESIMTGASRREAAYALQALLNP